MQWQTGAAEANGHGQDHVSRNSHSLRIATEIELAIKGATEVHHALSAPECQRIDGYEVAVRVVPARHLSGDFVYSAPHSKGTFVVLADLMGKGLSAAMWVTHIADLVHRAAEVSQDVCGLLRRLNMEIAGSRISAPLTSAVAISIEKDDGAVYCALAGHPPAIVLRRDSRAKAISAGGPLLGVFPNARYECERVRLGPGESLLAFSDGLSEALVHDVSSLGDAVANVAQDGSSAREMISNLLRASGEIGHGAPHDDISIVALQRL